MVVSSLIFLITGMLIGSRYSVYALIPVIALVATIVGLTAMLQSDPWYVVLKAMAGAATALQMGYLGFTIAMAVAIRHRALVLQDS